MLALRIQLKQQTNLQENEITTDALSDNQADLSPI